MSGINRSPVFFLWRALDRRRCEWPEKQHTRIWCKLGVSYAGSTHYCQSHSLIIDRTSINTSVLFMSVTHLTSNKDHSSIHVINQALVADDVASRRAHWLLIDHRSGVSPPTYPFCGHYCVFKAEVYLLSLWALFHNATEGCVSPHRHDFVLGVHLALLVVGYVLSWSRERRKSVANTSVKLEGEGKIKR